MPYALLSVGVLICSSSILLLSVGVLICSQVLKGPLESGFCKLRASISRSGKNRVQSFATTEPTCSRTQKLRIVALLPRNLEVIGDYDKR